MPLSHPALAAAAARGQDVIGDIELFARAAQAPVAAITGSNGKSTVTTLLGQMAQAAGRDVRVGGNLGTPALELLQDSEPDLYVLELSSFQLEGTRSLNAAAATVLNITPDHMDRYRSLADYSAAKQRIFRGDGVMVLNADDPAGAGDGRAGSAHHALHAGRARGGRLRRARCRMAPSGWPAAASLCCRCPSCAYPDGTMSPTRWRRWRWARHSTCRWPPCWPRCAPSPDCRTAPSGWPSAMA